jgi:long-chain fatty acid transport protein
MVNIMVLLLVGLMGLASNVNAAGFRLSEQDAKANGMGNSFVAVADNASAVWYNPAAMTDLEKTNLSLGSVMVAPAMKHENTAVNGGTSDEIKNTLHTPPYLYATHKLNEKWALGFGFNLPFGLSTDWDKNTATTKYIATLSDIKAFNYNLNGAYKVNDKLSVALGADYVYLDATLNKMATPMHPTWELGLAGTGHGWGYNAAALYKLDDKWSFGANYRSLVKIDVDGTAKVDAIGVSNDASTKITLPDTFQVGAGYKVNDKWLVSATADYTDWATYHNLKIVSNTIKTLTGSDTSYDIKDWQSVWAFRAGTEYKYSDTWKFRAGSFYDLNPVTEKHFETRVPDSDRLAFSIGAGYEKNNFVVDLSYTYLMFMQRTIGTSYAGYTASNATTGALSGKYTTSAHLPAFSVGYKF